MVRKAIQALAVILLAAGMAAATPGEERHLRLVMSDPGKDAVLATSPLALHLWYSEAPQLELTTLELWGPDGRRRKLEPVSADEVDGKHLSAPIGTPLTPGRWFVGWRTLGKDGHVVRGSFEFRIGTAP